MRNEIDNRREKLAEEMRSREVKCLDNRREKEQAKRQKLKITKKKIEEKDRKVCINMYVFIFQNLFTIYADVRLRSCSVSGSSPLSERGKWLRHRQS